MNIQPDPYCVGCDYLGGTGTCDYILLRGTRRPCKPAAIAPAPVPTAEAEPVPAKGMPAAELAGILHELADRYPGAEISFDERPVRGVYLDVSFRSDKTAPVAVITMR